MTKINHFMLLATVISMELLTGAELDLFVPSFPELQTLFNLTPFWVEALLSVNFIGYCISMFFVGGLADRYGRKPIILIGLIIFIIGSALCLMATSYGFLIFGRFLQGLGIAAPSILSFLIIADEYPIRKQQYLLAMLNGVINTSLALSPVIGSYITMYFHWRGNFVALFVAAIATLIMTTIFIPAYKLPAHKDPLSLRGYFPIFKSIPLVLLMVHICFMYAPYWIFVGMTPLLFMKDLGVSLPHYGLYQGFLVLVFAIGSIIFGLSMHKYNQAKALFLTNQIFIIGLITILVATFVDNRSALFITLCFMPFVIGQIIPCTILYPLCINFMPKYKGRITATVQGARLLLTAIALQIVGYFYNKSFESVGLVMSIFMLIAIITLFRVIKSKELMRTPVDL